MKGLIGILCLTTLCGFSAFAQVSSDQDLTLEIYEGRNNPFGPCYVDVYRDSTGEIVAAAEGRTRLFAVPLVTRIEGENRYEGSVLHGPALYTYSLEVETRDGQVRPRLGSYELGAMASNFCGGLELVESRKLSEMN